MALLLIPLTLILCSIIWYVWKLTYWKRKGIPFVKPTFPYGNLEDAIFYRCSYGELLGKLYNKLGKEKFGGFYLFHRPALLLRDPEIIKNILVRDFDHFVDRSPYVTGNVSPLDLNLVNLRGEIWKQMRRNLNPTFTSGKIKLMFETIKTLALLTNDSLKETPEKEHGINVSDTLTHYVTEIIGTCAFGVQMDAIKNPNSTVNILGVRNKRSNIKVFVATYLPFFSKIFSWTFVDNKRGDFVRKLVKETVEFREKNDIVRHDFLQLLIDLKNKRKVEDDYHANKEDSHLQFGVGKRSEASSKFVMTDDLLAAQCYVFFAAGQDTSITTMSFCLYELALHPKIQENVREEIDRVFKKYDGNLKYEALQELKYLGYVLNETLRKYPAVPLLLRTCTKKYNIPDTNFTIDPGTSVYVPVYGIHYDEKYFPNPKQFNPDRFSEAGKAVRPYTYLPFGNGPRMCIGMRFSEIQIKVGLAILLKNYEFLPCTKTTVPMVLSPASGIMLTYSEPIWLKIVARNS